MERNIGDQLNRAFEAYRQVSIEKDNAKKELQQMTEYYERYTQKLQKQIEDQQQLISVLEAQLLAATKPSDKMPCDPCNHLADAAAAFQNTQYPAAIPVAPVVPPVHSNIKYQDMLEAFEAIQGKFRQIQFLSRRQKDHLKKFHGRNETSNDQRFSMPIQCTDRTAESETPFTTTLRSAADIPLPPTSLASRGASPDDRDLVDSLTKLSVKFPPNEDSEYDFLNSTPERNVGPNMAVRKPQAMVAATGTEEEEHIELAVPFVFPAFPSHSTSPSLSQESVRGPQQPLWRPKPCHSADVETESSSSSLPSSSSPDKCEFCHAIVPQECMNSHLYSHFSPKSEADI
ncbi:TRAF family member-associated NF-kappa-B activator isoform X2 [Synchiropus splendidus]|uniref:TRAF family member-associated NF-kappa-B activator isoform X2 n=1 Tax=Synchiropus splendidus TaxID=270530 RepID=UPI00237E12CB|nr:TRAF family member-associated NF-kappa-B activator isoform X2 [Synchiropus splendidus]